MSLFKKKHDCVSNPRLKKLLLSLDDFLDTHYTFRCEKEYQGWIGRLRASIARDEVEEEEKKSTGERLWEAQVFGSNMYGLQWAIETARKEHLRNNFSTCLMRMIEARGLDAVSVYKRANIDRKLFSKIRTNIDYIPGKKTILALALAMELSLDETQDLLGKAGFKLSRSILSDVIIEFFISQGRYDLDEISAALYTYDQPVF